VSDAPPMFAVDMDGVIHVIENEQLLPTPFLDMGNDSRADLRFGTDAAGEIYLLTKRDGMIRRLSIAEH
jgi:hypothetical protein